MAFPLDQPFPMPPSPPLERYVGAEALRTYLGIFQNLRHERPGKTFTDADIFEFMRLAEHLGKVTKIEIQYIRKELLEKRGDLFSNEAQKARLRIFNRNHEERNTAADQDDFVQEILAMPPMPFFRKTEAIDLIVKAHELNDAINKSRAFYIEHGEDDPALVDAVNNLSNDLAAFVDDFSLSDLDEKGKAARKAHWRDAANYFRRLNGEVDHEAKWDAEKKTWMNWNRDILVYPATYIGGDASLTMAKLKTAIASNDPIRIVAGGHAFNTSSDTGGTKSVGVGTLITLDRLVLDGNKLWEVVPEAQAAQDYNLQDGKNVVRVSTGMRLRDFTEQVWASGMALPVAGSTDAQSIGGLLATDLHSTGHTAGFLSQQTLEVVTLDHEGKRHRFRRDASIPHGQIGRWTWRQPSGANQKLTKLPPAGGIGMIGVAVEAVLKLESKFNFEKKEQWVPRKWAEDNLARLLDPFEADPLFSYQHVSLYYVGGFGKNVQSVQLNTWKRTNKTPAADALRVKRERELLDHFGSAFFPNALYGLAKKKAPSPRDNTGGDAQLRQLNGRKPQVLQANHAFARKLYFQHDEIEAGIPLVASAAATPDYDLVRKAINATQDLLEQQEVRTIIEVRFTPSASEGMLGPGTGGPTCYIELATSMALYSRERIVQVFQMFDKLLREQFKARPHLGKKTSAAAADMAQIYGADWVTFNDVRRTVDPHGKFRPANNELLNRLFG